MGLVSSIKMLAEIPPAKPSAFWKEKEEKQQRGIGWEEDTNWELGDTIFPPNKIWSSVSLRGIIFYKWGGEFEDSLPSHF